jgi:hypothetical protein
MILNDDNRKFIAGVIDDAIDAKGVLELVDGIAARVILNVVDSFVDSKITVPDEIKLNLNALVEAAKEKDIERVEEIAAALIDSLVDIPGLDDEGEKILFEGSVKIIVGAIKTWLAKQD